MGYFDKELSDEYTPCFHGKDYYRRGMCIHPDHDIKHGFSERQIRCQCGLVFSENHFREHLKEVLK